MLLGGNYNKAFFLIWFHNLCCIQDINRLPCPVFMLLKRHTRLVFNKEGCFCIFHWYSQCVSWGIFPLSLSVCWSLPTTHEYVWAYFRLKTFTLRTPPWALKTKFFCTVKLILNQTIKLIKSKHKCIQYKCSRYNKSTADDWRNEWEKWSPLFP